MKWRLGSLALLAIMLGWWVGHIHLETRLSVFFLGSEDPAARLVERFQRSVFARRYLLAIEAEGKGQAGLPAIADRFLEQLAGVPGVASAWPAFRPPFSLPDLMVAYAPYAPLIYSLDPSREAPALFSPADLAKRAQGLKRALLSPFGDLIQRIAPRDPLLLSLRAFSDWKDTLKGPARSARDFYPILLETRFDPFDVAHQRDLQRQLQEIFAQLAQNQGGSWRLRMTGVPVFAASAEQRVRRDVTRVSVASSVGVTAVLLLLFRSWKILPLLVLVLGFAFSAGGLVTQWVFGNVHALTLALGTTLIGVCVDYPIHLLAHCRAGRSAVQVAARLGPALTMGAMTTVIGYLALAATGYPGFQQVAVFAATGIVVALLATLTVVPLWSPGAGGRGPLIQPFDPWLRWCGRHRRWTLMVLGVLTLLAMGALSGLRWLDDLERLAGIDPLLKAEDRELRQRLGGVEPGRAVLVEGRKMETALKRSEAATRILRRLKSGGELSAFHGLYPWLVSRQLQRSNWEAYRQAVTQDFVVAWQRALLGQGLNSEVLGLQLPDSRPERWLPPEGAADTPLEEILPGQIDSNEDGVQLALWLGPHDAQAVSKALAGLDGVRYFSQRERINQLAAEYRQRAMMTLSFGVGVIMILLLLRYRSLGNALRVLTPAVVGLVFVFASFAALGQPVSFFQLIAAMLAVAICVDYGIFFFERRAGDARDTYRAMGASMLTTVAAFAALGLADNPALEALAVAVSGGVVGGYLICPLVIAGDEGPKVGHAH